MFHDYESYGTFDWNRQSPLLLEVYSGTSIVQWYGNIERQLGRLLDDAEKGRNWPYAEKIRKFREIWRENEITGSMNRETLDVLKTGSDVLGVDNWNLSNYFSTLRDQLRKLIASEEELPRDMDMNGNDPMAGMRGAGRGAPPMSPQFGPEGEMRGAEGQDGTNPEAPDLEDPQASEGGEDGRGGLEGGPPMPGMEELPDDETSFAESQKQEISTSI